MGVGANANELLNTFIKEQKKVMDEIVLVKKNIGKICVVIDKLRTKELSQDGFNAETKKNIEIILQKTVKVMDDTKEKDRQIAVLVASHNELKKDFERLQKIIAGLPKKN